MANLGFLSFITVVIAIILIGLIIYIFRRIYGDKNEPRNEEIVINLLSNYTDGYGLLLVKKRESNKDLIHIIGLPRDIDYIQLNDKDFEVKEQDLFVRKDLFIPIDNSAHRIISIAFPDKPEQVPEKLKNTLFGELAMKFIADRNAGKDKLDVQKIREENMLKMTKQTEGLDLATEIAEFGFDYVKEATKSKTVPDIPKKNE